MAGSIDHIDTMLWVIVRHAFPEGGGRGRRNRNTALLLLFHPVHGGGAIMHFANLMIDACVKQDSFGRCGFPCVDMCRDTDVAVALDRGFARHG